MHRLAVETAHWMTYRQFTDLFAVTQATPGPNVMMVAVIGWRAAGAVGAVTAMAGMVLPSSILTYNVVRLWDRFRDRPWRQRIQYALTPVTAGLVAASAFLLTRGADVDIVTVMMTMAAAIISFHSKLNPLWLLAGGGVLGALVYT
jgi:chromate transporter